MGKYFFSKKIIRLFGKKQSASNAEIIAIFFLILGGVLRDCFFFLLRLRFFSNRFLSL
jgi:hypothetical protein